MALFNYECDEVKHIIDEVSPNYPQLTTYEKEWLFFHRYGYIPGVPVELEYETVNVNPTGSVSNAIPFQYNSAILNGNTKYRDIDTGDILDTFDETKNLELVSVKMPVLKTVGKNLFDGELLNGLFDKNISTISGDGTIYKSIKIKLAKGTYTLSFDNPILIVREIKDGIYEQKLDTRSTYTFTVNTDGYYGISFREAGESRPWTNTQGMIEKGTTVTTYEPYKSNILSTSEEVELCGIGDVKDELDLITGELTQRIGEYSLDGSGIWVVRTDVYKEGYIYFQQELDYILQSKNIAICERLPYFNETHIFSEQLRLSTYGNRTIIGVRLSESKGVSSLDEFSEYLKSNPIKFKYPLTTASIKTVDLTPLNKPYEGTNHYELSSNIPCEAILEVPVVSTGKQTLEEINN